MVGYTNNGYRLWNEKEEKIEIARDMNQMKFNENKENEENTSMRQTITVIASDNEEEINHNEQEDYVNVNKIQLLEKQSSEIEESIPVTIEEKTEHHCTVEKKEEEEGEYEKK